MLFPEVLNGPDAGAYASLAGVVFAMVFWRKFRRGA